MAQLIKIMQALEVALIFYTGYNLLSVPWQLESATVASLKKEYASWCQTKSLADDTKRQFLVKWSKDISLANTRRSEFT